MSQASSTIVGGGEKSALSLLWTKVGASKSVCTSTARAAEKAMAGIPATQANQTRSGILPGDCFTRLAHSRLAVPSLQLATPVNHLPPHGRLYNTFRIALHLRITRPIDLSCQRLFDCFKRCICHTIGPTASSLVLPFVCNPSMRHGTPAPHARYDSWQTTVRI